MTTRPSWGPKAPYSQYFVAAWNALSRDEQAPRYRDALADPACDAIANKGMSDILASARQRRRLAATGSFRGEAATGDRRIFLSKNRNIC